MTPIAPPPKVVEVRPKSGQIWPTSRRNLVVCGRVRARTWAAYGQNCTCVYAENPKIELVAAPSGSRAGPGSESSMLPPPDGVAKRAVKQRGRQDAAALDLP